MWRPFIGSASPRPLLRRLKSTLEQHHHHASSVIPIVDRRPVVPHSMTPQRSLDDVPASIRRPSYASSGLPSNPPGLHSQQPIIHTDPGPLRRAGQLARTVLKAACRQCVVGRTTTEIDTFVYEYITQHNAYPSPLNYMGFPKSVCTSVNEVICHGIPDDRPLQFGDVVSLDVSCFTHEGVHGDNCATVIVGDVGSPSDTTTTAADWQGIPFRTEFATTTTQCAEHFQEARRLSQAAQDCLAAGIEAVRPGGCLSSIGAACHAVADHYGYASVEAYRGHGIGSDFHIPPFVSHVRNDQRMELRPNMIFTIEPMICTYSGECFEWETDGWTVATVDGGLAAQFEHMVRVTDIGVEILTWAEDDVE